MIAERALLIAAVAVAFALGAAWMVDHVAGLMP